MFPGLESLGAEVKDRDLSRTISQVLRHAPWLFELDLDEEGWADVQSFLCALRSLGGEWAYLSLDDLERVVSTGNKRRYEIVGMRIRALYGHSVAVRFPKEGRLPPSQLYHGTSAEVAQLAVVEGTKTDGAAICPPFHGHSRGKGSGPSKDCASFGS